VPGTELSFAHKVRRERLWFWSKNVIHHRTAIFRQINLDNPLVHHDALEFPDGKVVLLTYLMEGQQATVLQLPAPTAVGAKAPQRTAHVLDPLSESREKGFDCDRGRHPSFWASMDEIRAGEHSQRCPPTRSRVSKSPPKPGFACLLEPSRVSGANEARLACAVAFKVEAMGFQIK
jgi:hypothetical protein